MKTVIALTLALVLAAQAVDDWHKKVQSQRVRGSKYTIHENYNPVTIENDLCIIHLDAEVRGEGIATLRLPSRSQAEMTFAGHKATIAGWGETSDNDTIMNTVLRYTDVMTIMKNDDCRRYYELITATMLCANSPDGSGVCMGDSGSPLTITESDGVKTQVGISSFSPSVGCETLRPDGYVRLTEYLDWVEKWAEVDIRP
ncbi:brachyurin-like [Cloeon dipterum]|uniref:brachyurin-like n=1 Tax=Cloeon dipterum TaxID=197152 RepID=UPI003220371B